MEKKICSSCKEEKPLSEFRKHKKNKDGLAYDCKVCHNEYGKNWARSSDFNEKRKKRYAEDEEYREKDKARRREYYRNNKEKTNAAKLEYRNNNRDKHNEQVRRYRKNNPEKMREKKRKRRAAKSGNGGSFTDKEWRELCDKYDNICLCCGEKKELYADHVIPVTWDGGHSNIDNIQPLCQPCNSRKGNRSSTDYRDA